MRVAIVVAIREGVIANADTTGYAYTARPKIKKARDLEQLRPGRRSLNDSVP
jgi:hypothetical protein